MNRSAEHAARLRRHLEAILDGRNALENPEPINEAVGEGVDARQLDLVLGGLENLRTGSELSDDELGALEAIVLPNERPVIDIVDDSFGALPAPWSHLANPPLRATIEAAIPSIGRIELVGRPGLPYAGTGFVVGDGLLMTNRHVAALFTTGVGRGRRLRFIAGLKAGIDFKREVTSRTASVIAVKRVVMIHPFWDCALLEVVGLTEPHTPLALQSGEPAALRSDIVVIGYPAKDPRNDVALQDRIFGGTYQRKRLQPGRLGRYQKVRSFGNDVEAVTHDSSTLGGNSGSAVFDVSTGKVVGLHFAGRYLEANFAVPMWELALDARIVDAGVRFEPAAAPKRPPAWSAAWGALEGRARPMRPPRPIVAGESVTMPLDWYERIDDTLLTASLERDFEGTRARLIAVLGEDGADDAIDDLLATDDEGLFGPDIDPNLPQILYLHGIMGGHLAHANGTGSRVWLDPLQLLIGNVANKMRLAGDGLSSSQPGLSLGPDGHLRTNYAQASRAWRRRGFVVHDIAYDWRKPLATSADRLHAIVESLAAGHPDPRFVIAAHSMGGLVACVYANRHGEWADRIEAAAFAGSPLGGSYAPVEAVLGVYPLMRTLAKVALRDDVDEFRTFAASLPGLLEMLPNRDLFPADPVDCYAPQRWPRQARPQAKWLAASAALKGQLLGSPLLARTTGIVSRRHGTVASVVADGDGRLMVGPATGPGDGTVPIQASAVAGLRGVVEGASARHSDLMRDGAVIDGMAQLFAGQALTALRDFDRETIDPDEVVQPSIENPEVLEALEVTRADEVRAHAAAGCLTESDIRFLFDPAAELGLA
jgi:pimeloyl-ACP methyl ester carboxylesterase